MKSKLANIPLVTVVILILALILLTSSTMAANKYLKKSTQVNRIDSIQSMVSDLLDSSFSNPEVNQTRISKFILNSNELYLFFSAGDGDIFLSRKFPPGDGDKLINSDLKVKYEHYLKFERPDVTACKDTACVCYCPLQFPPWTKIKKEPYLNAIQITLIHDKSDKGFVCKNPKCEQVGNNNNKKVYFGNSRGLDKEYFDNVEKKVYLSEITKSHWFEPTPMDISLIIQNELSNKGSSDGGLLFSIFGYHNQDSIFYTNFYQDNSIVKNLIEEYYWENGVVIGGTGYAEKKDDKKNHNLRGPLIKITFESVPNKPGLIGVCLQGKCLFPKGIEKLSKDQTKDSFLEKASEDARNNFLRFNVYLQGQFMNSIDRLSMDPTKNVEIIKTFNSELDKLFTSFKSIKGAKPELIFKINPINKRITTPVLKVGGKIVYEGNSLPINFPYENDENQFDSDIEITGFVNDEIVLIDGSKRNAGILKMPDGSYTLYFKPTNYVQK